VRTRVYEIYPYKIELNEKGQVLMTPVKVYHSAFQGKIAHLFPETGIVLPECAVKNGKRNKGSEIQEEMRGLEQLDAISADIVHNSLSLLQCIALDPNCEATISQ